MNTLLFFSYTVEECDVDVVLLFLRCPLWVLKKVHLRT